MANQWAREGNRVERPVILVVDDDLDLRELVAAFLADVGYEPFSFGDGAEALDFSRQWPKGIALVISDVDMPRMDGLELCLHLNRERPDTRFLLMTGKSGTLDGIGAPFVLHKPFRTATLLKLVQGLLEGSGPVALE